MIYNPINEGKTPEQISAVKSIWIEASNTKDNIWLNLFTDYGILNNHEFILNCHNIDRKEIMKKVIEADQVCFNSSVVFGQVSTKLIIDMLDVMKDMGIKGKTFISAGYLLGGLNNGFTIPDAERFSDFFENNYIYELDQCFKRIKYDGHKYVYVTKKD